MSLLTKSWIATVFIASGAVALWSMFTLLGKAEKNPDGKILRRLHRAFGFVFLALLLVLTYYCAKYVRIGGDNLPIRGVIHSVLALGLLVIALLKVMIVRLYRQFLRFVPVMGIMIFVLALLVYATSAGFFFLVRAGAQSVRSDQMKSPLSALEEKGKAVFGKQCVFCHHADKPEPKLGPGLKGLLKDETFPASGQPATLENVKRQLLEPTGSMPSFKTVLSEEDLEALLAYLGTL